MLTESELVQRDAARDLGEELLESVRAMKAGQAAHKTEVAVPLAVVDAARVSVEVDQLDKC